MQQTTSTKMIRKALCLDTELSCWLDSAYQRKQISEVFEFGMALVNIDELRIEKTGRYYIKNSRHPVTEFCTQLTGITQRRLDKQGFELEHAARLLTEKWGVSNYKIPIITWGDERLFMERDFIEKGVKYPFHNGMIDLGSYFRHSIAMGSKGVKLTRVCKAYGAEIQNPIHSAESDAITTANLLIKMVEAGDIFKKIEIDVK